MRLDGGLKMVPPRNRGIVALYITMAALLLGLAGKGTAQAPLGSPATSGILGSAAAPAVTEKSVSPIITKDPNP